MNIKGYISAPQVSANGKAAEYFSDAIFKFSRISKDGEIKNGKDVIGLKIQIENKTKNRYTTPFQSGVFTLMLPHIDPDTGILTAGVDEHTDLVEALIDKNIITGSSYYYYKKDEPDEIKWHGKAAIVRGLKTNIDHYNLFKNLVYGTTSNK